MIFILFFDHAQKSPTLILTTPSTHLTNLNQSAIVNNITMSSPQLLLPPIDPQTHFGSRQEVRRGIHVFLTRILRQYARQPFVRQCRSTQRRLILNQSYLFDSIIYKRSYTLEEYFEKSTLERRVMENRRALIATLTRQMPQIHT